jgi:glycosyltransferase involved in cell wall biosynthesis
MRIAINARFLLTGKLEGIGWFTYEICKRLVQQHPEHEFVFFFDRPFDPEFIFGKNVTPVVLFPPARHPFLFFAWFEFAVTRALKRHKIDVFFSPDGFMSLTSKVPTLLTIHDLAYAHFPEQIRFMDRKYYQYFMPRFARKAAKITTVSEFTKQDIMTQLSLSSDKIDVVYNGCRTFFTPMSIAEKAAVKNQYSGGEDYFVYIGAIHPRKNVHRLISAFDAYKQRSNSKAKLLLGGRFAWQVGAVKDAFDQTEYKDDILFLGYLNTTELHHITASALAMVYVSTFEGFGVPLLEAMHCDVPTITSTTSSMPEVVGDAGICIAPEDVEGIADAMFRVERDTALRAMLIERGRLQRQKFSWDISANQIWAEILELGNGQADL